MKKAILLLGFAVVMLFGSASVNAQYRQDNGRHRGWEQRQERRYEQDRRYNDYSRVEVRNEYRYVRYGYVVYKEIYRTTYRIGRYGNEEVINRILIRRERYNDYDRYSRTGNSGIRFNVFLRF
jgi:hypothetical protein